MTENVNITSDKCWVCDKNFGAGDLARSSHHGIPVNMNPKNNVVIPICVKCHKKLHTFDKGSLIAILYKTMKQIRELSNRVEYVKKIVVKEDKDKNES